MSAATASAMSQPPPPPGPPRSASQNISKGTRKKPGPPPPAPRRPPAPPRPLPPGSKGRAHPPPPPRSGKRPAPPHLNGNGGQVQVKKARKPIAFGKISIKKPTVLRDVSVFHRKHKVGQGTYGEVFMGADKVTGEIVALKRINTEQEENGFPITAIREVKILKALEHKNIVKLKEIVTSKEQNGANEGIPRNVYMVFEYHEYDLTGILQSNEIRLSQDHIKSWSQQLLAGTHYMHVNKIIHRDLKASNILIGKNGQLKIADWGLARSWNADMKRLTNPVVTLWYRPIELLLGCKEYSPKIDIWSVGCIIAEMFRRDGLLKGIDGEASQLNLIFQMCGHPDVNEWPNIRQMCPLWTNYEPRPDEKPLPCKLAKVLKQRLPHPHWMTNSAIDLIKNLLTYDPEKRWSASKALGADYFFENPMVKDSSKLHMKFGVDSVHELSIRQKHISMRAANGSRPNPPTRK